MFFYIFFEKENVGISTFPNSNQKRQMPVRQARKRSPRSG